MKILIPSKRFINLFFEEIIKNSQHEFVFGNYTSFDASYDLVMVHWPEAIFNWKEPNENELNELSFEITRWKKNAKVVYVVHNEKRHFGMTDNFEKLYALILSNADSMLHFGDFSKNKFQDIYLWSNHYRIEHPLYLNTFKVIDKKEARKQLGIPEEKLVVIVPGQIRSIQERNFIKETFNNWKRNDIFIIISNLNWVYNLKEFRGRNFLKKLIDIKKIYENYQNRKGFSRLKFLLNFSFNSFQSLSIYMSAADIVFIPRLEILNSGNFYLGLSFNKPVVGSGIGNLKEHLEGMNLYWYEPGNIKSAISALDKTVNQINNNQINLNVEKYFPTNVTKIWDEIILNIFNCKVDRNN